MDTSADDPSDARQHDAGHHAPAYISAVRRRIEELLDEYRVSLNDSVNGLTDDEARLRLVDSKTTMLGLIKHATYLEGFYLRPRHHRPLLHGDRHRQHAGPIVHPDHG